MDKINDIFASARIQPHTYTMDNEASDHFKAALVKKETIHQLSPHRYHRANLSERVIQTFKNYLKAGLATTDPEFPAEYDRFIQQAEVTLNLLRVTKVNPRLPVYAYIFRKFDANVTPMTPPGTKVLAHLNPRQRQTLSLHGE